MKHLWWAAAGFLAAFFVLLAVRLDIPAYFFSKNQRTDRAVSVNIIETDTWMNLFLNDRKIGYSHSALTKCPSGYQLEEMLQMRVNTMGFSQDIRMNTAADLNPDLSLANVDFRLNSGRFEFAFTGRLKPGNVLTIETDTAGSSRKSDIQLAHPPHLAGAVVMAAARTIDRTPGSRLSFHLFDPATLSQVPVTVSVIGKEEISNMGRRIKATKLRVHYKGATQTVWVDRQGEIVREKGILGLTLEKTSKQDATGRQSLESGEDIVEIASVPTTVGIDAPRKTTFLKIELDGFDLNTLDVAGGRQRRNGNVLTIQAESPTNAFKSHEASAPQILGRYLTPEPFIESDHPAIANLAAEAVSEAETLPAKARKLVDWAYKNIQKRPVISIPDALTTFKSRAGDCNEHAVLLAALARSVGIPAKIESGLVYLNGRFFYHAWNSLYVGRWVTADSVFGQMPADATHIRFASGGPGSPLDLMPVIDNLGITVLENRP
jgi:hypothetical protein